MHRDIFLNFARKDFLKDGLARRRVDFPIIFERLSPPPFDGVLVSKIRSNLFLAVCLPGGVFDFVLK